MPHSSEIPTKKKKAPPYPVFGEMAQPVKYLLCDSNKKTGHGGIHL